MAANLYSVTVSGGLSSGAFLQYWRADAVSGLGTYVTLFTLQVLVVVTLDGSASDVGWVNAARWLPFLVLGLVVGAVVDGRRRLPLMVGSQLAQAAILVTIPVMWGLDLLSVPTLMAVVAAYGAVSVVNRAATMSFLPRLVAASDLQPAHARLDGSDAVASTAGPALGGLLVSVLAAPLAVLVDCLSYLYSALTLRRIDLDELPPKTGVTARSLLRDMVDGVRWAYGGSGLRVLAVATHGWFVGNAIAGVVLAPYVLLVLDLSAFQFGLVGAAGGVGAALGASVTTWVGRRLGTGRTVVGSHLLTTAGVVVLALAGIGMTPVATVLVVMVGQALYGVALGMSNSHEMSYRQLVTPDELQARTNTTLHSFNRAIVVVVAPVAGILADTWGARPMLWAAAAVFALVGVGLAATPFRSVRAPT